MALNIQIKVDAAQAKTDLDNVKTSLTGVEQQSTKTSAAAKDVGDAHKHVSDSSKEASQALSMLGARAGEAGSALSEIATKGELGALALAGLGVAAIEASNQWTEMSNSALRLVDATHNVNDVMSQQLDLAGQLHASMEETIEVSAAVKEGTDDMNLSAYEQERVTRSIVEAVQLSGKSMSEAVPLAEKLSYQFASGTVTGRELKQEMREFPALGDLLVEAFGKSRAELVKMGDAGQLTGPMILNALSSAGAGLDENFSRHVETAGQKWDHFKDDVISGADDVAKGVQVLGAIMDAGDPFTKWKEDAEAAEAAQRKLNDSMVAAGRAIATEVEAFKALDDLLVNQRAILSGISPGVVTAAKDLNDYGNTVANAKDKLNALYQEEKAIRGAMGQGGDTIVTDKNDTNGQQALMAAAQRAVAQGQGSAVLAHIVAEEAKAQKALGDAVHDVEPTKKTTDPAAAWNAMNADILNPSFQNRLAHRYGMPQNDPLTQLSIGPQGASSLLDSTGAGLTPDDGKSKSDAMDANTKSLQAMYEGTRTSVEKYQDALAQLDDTYANSNISAGKYAAIVADLKTKYTDVVDPLEKFQKAEEKLKAEQDAGLISLKSYNDEMRKLREGMGQGTWGDGLIDGLDKVKKEMTDVSTATEKLFTDAFHGAEDALVQFMTTGDASGKQLLQTLQKDLATSLVKQGESALVGLFKGSGGSGGNAIDAIRNSSLGKIGGISGSGADAADASLTAVSSAADATSSAFSAVVGAAQAAASALSSVSASSAGAAATHFGGSVSLPSAGGGLGGGSSDLGSTAPVSTVPDVSERVAGSGGRVQAGGSIVAGMDNPNGERLVANVIKRNPNAVRSYLGIRKG